jgi:hypothetical protein
MWGDNPIVWLGNYLQNLQRLPYYKLDLLLLANQ